MKKAMLVNYRRLFFFFFSSPFGLVH
jgi:hypothetical protein